MPQPLGLFLETVTLRLSHINVSEQHIVWGVMDELYRMNDIDE